MFNSGIELSKIDGSEFKYEVEKNEGIPTQFSYMKQLPPVLNQGDDPICVPCSISAFLEYQLSLKSGSISNSKFELFDIFNSRTNTGEGMTCKEAFKYVINTGAKYKDGLIKIYKYFIISSIYTLRHAIYSNGPCILVLPVYNSDITEFWKKSGKRQGYHAVSVVGYDESGFIIRNSWGASYGHDGYAYITNEDINKSKEIWTLVK
jgi:hypothetical protein